MEDQSQRRSAMRAGSSLSGAADTRAGFGQLRSLAGPHLLSRAATALRVVLGIIIFFLILEFATRLELVPPIYLPRASTVVRRMVELLQDPKFLRHIIATLHAWARRARFCNID